MENKNRNGLRNPRLRIAYFLELLQKYSYSVDDGRIVEATAHMHGDIRDLSLGSEIAVTVDYLDNEGSEFSESFTYAAIDEAFATDDRIILDNTDGERAVFRFYEVKRVPVKEDLFASAKKPKP